MLRISVVIPVLNDAEMLRTALTALRLQTVPPSEIVVVDNGSTDESAAVARAFGAVIITEPIKGIPRATAAGFDAATGDVIARLDADSIAPVDWLARIDDAFTRDPHLAALTGPGDFYGDNAVVHGLGRALYIGGFFWSMGIALGHAPLFGSNFAISAIAWKRIAGSIHRDIREIHDDLDISFQFRPDMRVVYDPEFVVEISARPFSSSSALVRRIDWAFRTIALNWREEDPVHRRLARALTPRPPAEPSTGLERLLEEGQQISAQLIWGRLARAVTGSVDSDRGTDAAGEPSVLAQRPKIVRPHRNSKRNARLP